MTLGTQRVSAQEAPDLATRRLLIEQAQQSAGRGEHVAAIALGERAMGIQATPSLMLFLAGEYLASGQPHRAFTYSERCALEAGRTSVLPNRAALLQACSERSQQVRATSAVLVLRVSAGDATAAVRLDEVELSSAQLGAPMFIAAGAHTIRAQAPGYVATQLTFEARTGATIERQIALVREETRVVADRVVEARPQARVLVQGSRPPTATPVDAPRARRPSLVAPIVVTSSALAVAASSAVFFALRSDSLRGCTLLADEVRCVDRASADRVPDARTYNGLAIGSLAAGLSIAAVGAVWWALAARRSERTTVALAAGVGSIEVRGAF